MVKLEVGPGHAKKSGGGYVFRPHCSPDHDVVYLDVKAPDFKCSRCYWVVADAQYLPFRGDSVDEIYAGHVIEHLESPLRFLRECRRVLRRGGMVTVVTPNFLSKNAYLDPDHKHVFNFVKLWRLVKMAGLRPHFPSPNIGSLFPRKIKLFFKLILLFLSDNLTVMGEKT